MFFFAGYDTTATASSFLMYLLALHPEMQQKLHEEIVETLGDKVDLVRDIFSMRGNQKDFEAQVKLGVILIVTIQNEQW